MSFLSSLDIAGSGLTATRMRMDVISENIANAETTRTEDGGPYRRKMVVYQEVEGDSFQNVLNKTLSSGGNEQTAGVQVAAIVEDDSDFESVYDPTNPDADENGYVLMPNVDTTQETLDLMSATNAYQLNLTAVNAVKQMAAQALEIGK